MAKNSDFVYSEFVKTCDEPRYRIQKREIGMCGS